MNGHDALITLDLSDLSGAMTIHDDPEWRQKLAARRGNPSGAHIRDWSGDEEVAVDGDMSPKSRPSNEQLMEFLQGLGGPPKKPIFDLTIGWPVILGVLGMLVSAIVFGVTSTWAIYSKIDGNHQSEQDALIKTQQETSKNISQLAGLVQTTQQSVDSLRLTVDDMQKATLLRQEKYAPKIEAQEQLQAVTNNTLEAMRKSISDLRDAVQDEVKMQNADHTDLQVLKAQGHPSGPRDMGR